MALRMFHDLVKTFRKNGKQLRNKEVIIINDVSGLDISIASYAARFRGNAKC